MDTDTPKLELIPRDLAARLEKSLKEYISLKEQTSG
jgi:hypothetical protein